jgi:hypothetical protein
MTVQDDIIQVQQDLDELARMMAGGTNLMAGGPIVSTSDADWQTIDGSIAILNNSAQFANSNDYASLINAVHAIRDKWNAIVASFPGINLDIGQLRTDAAAAAIPTVIAPFPPAPTIQPPGVVVVPPGNTTTVAAPGFTGGQTAAVGLVGAALGLGAGYLMWKSPHRVSNPRRRRHRAREAQE